VVELPRGDHTPAPFSVAEASTTGPRRPPVLASEILRQQMEPAAPGEDALRRLTVLVGIAGATLALAFGGASTLSLGATLVCVVLATLGFVPIPYGVRAIAAFVVGLAAAAAGAAFHPSVPATEASLALLVIGLGASLRLREYYRASRVARVLVATFVVAMATWLFASGSGSALFDIAPRWEGWAPTLVYAVLVVLLFLSLLAFMEPATRGGCHLWASLLGTWYLVHVVVDALAKRSTAGIAVWHLDQAALPVLAIAGVLVAITAGGQVLGLARQARVT
jgi:hypothetical protein